MADWYDITSAELCDQISCCISTTMYNTKIQEFEISGESFFGMSESDWAFFFQTVDMKSFQHMMKLRKWSSECKESNSIVVGVPKLVPTGAPLQPAQSAATSWPSQLARVSGSQEFNNILKRSPGLPPTKAPLHPAYSSFTPRGNQSGWLTLEEGGKNSGTQALVEKQTSGSDLISCGVSQKRFYPAPEELFNVANKSQGRSILARNHEEAHQSHKANFRIVRSWFATYATNKELYDFLKADFKADTETKESYQNYMRSRMHELLPLQFVCPETGAKHEMPWPESFLFEVVKNRKHEWRKTNAKKKKDSIPCSRKQEPTDFEHMKATADEDESLAIEYCNKYPEYALELSACSLEQTLEDLQSRESSIPSKIQGQHYGATFGCGIAVSIHVINFVRCFKVKFMESTIFKPSENKWVGGLWVPLMTPTKGFHHLQVQQIKPGMVIFIPRSQYALSPNLAPTICPQRSPGISISEEAFGKEALQNEPLDELQPPRGKTQSLQSNDLQEEEAELEVGLLPMDSTNKSLYSAQENNEAEVDSRDTELMDLTQLSQGKESSTSTVHLQVACFNEEQDGVSFNSDDATEPELIKRQKIEGLPVENNNSLLSKVQIEKDLEQGGVLASKSDLINICLSRSRRGKAHNADKENAPSFRAISTKVQENASKRLLTGKNIANQAETLCLPGSRTRLGSLSHVLEDNNIDVGKLSSESKLVVCMTAMGLLRISKVEAKLKGFVQETNQQSKTNRKPFTKHTQKTSSELAEMVAKWCIEQNVVIIRDPPAVRDGVQRLFPENVIKASS